MFLRYILKKLVKIGTLTLIDPAGQRHVFSATLLPQITMHVHTKRLANRLAYSPILALGEGYMDGELSVEQGNIYDLLSFFATNLHKRVFLPVDSFFDKMQFLLWFAHKHNGIYKAKDNAAHHYDLSQELYNLFLDRDMQYSCAYFTHLNDDLDTAQMNKKRHLAAKLALKPGQQVLDIGSGWGGLAIYLAREADVYVTGLTLSEEQYKVATERVQQAGLAERVRFYLRDYRHETQLYDRIVSVGMFEHVGVKHYADFFQKVHSLLCEDGIALLHSIGCSTGPSVPNPWLEKYIFPGGYCPALSETLSAIEPAGLTVTDIEILHHHYAETLRHWRARFMAQQEKAKTMMGERFCKMWEYYLACCEVAFRKRGYMVFQIQMVRDAAVAPLTRDYIHTWERNHETYKQEQRYKQSKAR